MKIRHIEIKNFRGIESLAWHVHSDFNCIIGPGDTCKTTILTALDYALSPRHRLSFDDSDFFNQDVTQPIVIQVTLTDWDATQPAVRKLFSEDNYAQFQCGLDHTGPLAEPLEGGTAAFSIALTVDDSLEPKWHAVRGRDKAENGNKKAIYAADRAVLGMSRVDVYADFHFTWSNNTILTRLGADDPADHSALLSSLARDMRQSNISGHESVAKCQSVADKVRTASQNAGVRLNPLSPKIDLQRRSVTAGALSLHEDNVPLRNKGSGSKKLIAAAMQMKLHDGKNISLIDEIETGLEPHRIRGLLLRLKKAGQQIFTTTHSPVVIRELSVRDNELYVCKRDADGHVSLASLNDVSGIQGGVRMNAEAFLGAKIIACEGPTEIGILRAYDRYRFDNAAEPPVWSLATAYFQCQGGGDVDPAARKLAGLGYRTAAFCDNDAPDQISAADIAALAAAGIHVCHWEDGHSTETQLFHEYPWAHLPDLLNAIALAHGNLTPDSILEAIIKHPAISAENLSKEPATWPDSPALRNAIGELVGQHKWIKRIDRASLVYIHALHRLPEGGTIKTRLDALWTWIQNE